MISESHTGYHSDFSQYSYPMRNNLNVLKMKTSWYLYRKISFKLEGKTFLKCLGICFSQPLTLSPKFHATAQCNPTLSTLVFIFLQMFESTLYVRYCCIIKGWSSDFNPSSYLQLNGLCSLKLYSRCISWRLFFKRVMFRTNRFIIVQNWPPQTFQYIVFLLIIWKPVIN